MGAKYLPTIKDQKFNLRYHTKKSLPAVFRKDAVAPAPTVSSKAGADAASRTAKAS